jgi:hypothetical protein
MTDDYSVPLPLQGEGFSTMATVRSRVMLEVASTMAGWQGWPHKQAAIDLRAQGASEWAVRLLASDAWDAVGAVLDGLADVAILNPATVVLSAARRHGGDAAELAGIATIPSYDQLGLAVDRDLGVETLEELVAARPPLRLSLRGARPNHSVHVVLEDTLAAAGTSLDDIRSWGGEVTYDLGLAQEPTRTQMMTAGTVNAVFDEGVPNWCATAVASNMRFLQLGADTLARMHTNGYRPGILPQALHPELGEDIHTVDFSGFMIYTRAEADPDVIETFCRTLADARARIAWEGGMGLPLARMVGDAVDAPMPLALHPAAERVWSELGYLGRHGAMPTAVD